MIRTLKGLVAIACATALPALAQLTPTAGAELTLNRVVVDDRLHHQTNPHVDGDYVVYSDFTNGGEILLKDLSTAASPIAVPRPGAVSDALSDVSDSTIVFQRATSTSQHIYVVKIAADGTPGAPVELAPTGAPSRTRASIGATTVAFEDLAFSDGSPAAELAVADAANPSAAAQRLTTDALYDQWPSVSADGNRIVFEKCASPSSGCTVAQAARVNGAWALSPVTTATEPLPAEGVVPNDTRPTTNGVAVVYGSNRRGQDDIWVAEPNGAGYDHFFLALDGFQWRPTLSRDFIAFESAPTRSGPFDIFLFHRSSNTLYQLTSTATVSESLTDLSVSAGGLIRVVWAQRKPDGSTPDLDVHALSAVISSPTPCEEDDDDDGDPEADDPAALCEHAAENRPLLAELSVTRGTGAPQSAHATFGADGDEGLLCVTNGRATAGAVTLNGQAEIGPDSFKHKTALIAREVDLEASNELVLDIAGERGTWFTARVYGETDECVASRARRAGLSGSRAVAALRDVSAKVETVELVPGARSSVLSDRTRVIEQSMLDRAMGCSTTGGTTAVGAAVLVALWLLSRRQPARERARRRR